MKHQRTTDKRTFKDIAKNIEKGWEAILRNGNCYKKMPNGKYFSVNSLSELKKGEI